MTHESALAKTFKTHVRAFVTNLLEMGELTPGGERKILSALDGPTTIRASVLAMRGAGLVNGEDIHPTALKMLSRVIRQHDERDVLFLDTETLGLDPYAPIWELAAVRRSMDTRDEEFLEMFVSHDPKRWVDTLPKSFRDDYENRYDPQRAVTPYEAAHLIVEFAYGEPELVGAVPSFDAERIARQWLEPLGFDRPWHYHVTDVESEVRGFLRSKGKARRTMTSDELSLAVGVNPGDYARHTAMGDVRWVMAQWDALDG